MRKCSQQPTLWQLRHKQYVPAKCSAPNSRHDVTHTVWPPWRRPVSNGLHWLRYWEVIQLRVWKETVLIISGFGYENAINFFKSLYTKKNSKKEKFVYQDHEEGDICTPRTRRKWILYTKDNTKKKELIIHNSCEGKRNSKRLWRMANSESTFLSSSPRFPKGALLSDVSQVSLVFLLVRATCRWNISQRRLFRHKSDMVWPGIELGPPRWGTLITLH